MRGAFVVSSSCDFASDSDTLLLLEDEPEDEVSEMSGLFVRPLVGCCSGSESELDSDEEEPDDDVSSFSDCSNSEKVDEVELDVSERSYDAYLAFTHRLFNRGRTSLTSLDELASLGCVFSLSEPSTSEGSKLPSYSSSESLGSWIVAGVARSSLRNRTLLSLSAEPRLLGRSGLADDSGT